VLLGYARRAWVEAYRPDPDRARRGVERFVRRFGRSEPIQAAALRAVAAYRRADLEEAARHASAWSAASPAVGQETTVPPVKAFLILARARAVEGRHGRARDELVRGLAAAEVSFWVRDRVEAGLHVAAWLLDGGRSAAARELLSRVVRHPACDPLMRADVAGLPVAGPLEAAGPAPAAEQGAGEDDAGLVVDARDLLDGSAA
jgi:ATP/maltotriose-dependent transcriptional regulator MalT